MHSFVITCIGDGNSGDEEFDDNCVTKDNKNMRRSVENLFNRRYG